MSIVLPDNGIPVQIGDTSYVYKDVYNPITWIGNKPYRPRVETLVIRDGREVFLKMRKKTSTSQEYELPGGSLDTDSSKIQQAENETNEEILAKVKNIGASGVQYYSTLDPTFVLNHDTPLDYFGFITDVYYAEYDGPYDKSKVEKKDLDPDMASGKWYPLTKVADIITEPHMNALLACPFISDGLKGSMRFIRRNKKSEVSETVIPESEKKFYMATYAKLTDLRVEPKDPQRSYLSTNNTKRIEFYPDINDAIIKCAKNQPMTGITYFIYELEPAYKDTLKLVSADDIPLVTLTNERWATTPVVVKYIGEVVIVTCRGNCTYVDKFGITRPYPIINYTFTSKAKVDCVNPLTEEAQSPVIIPDKLYHGSSWRIERFQPMSLDIGNAYQQPGWSTFCWKDYTLAIRFGLMRSIQTQLKWARLAQENSNNGPSQEELICGWDARHRKPYISKTCFEYAYRGFIDGAKYYVYTINPNGLNIGVGNDFGDPEYTFREANVSPEKLDTITITPDLMKEHCVIIDDWKQAKANEKIQKELFPRYEYLSLMQRNFNTDSVQPLFQAVKDGLLKPGDNIVDYMDKNGIEIQEIPLTSRLNNVTYEAMLPSMKSNNPSKKAFFISESNMNNKTISPRVPTNYFTKNGYEDNKTPRICVSTSIDGCLVALSSNIKGKDFYVHEVDISNIDIHKPTKSEVPDCKITHELWVLKPVKLICTGKIHVLDAKPDPVQFNYGDGKSAELYKWDWNWVSKETVYEAMLPSMESTRSELPDSAFGVPEQRKFPLDSEEHVRSAIRFFNYVDEKYEKELARNILKAMKKYHIDNVNVGEKNRFHKYYTNQESVAESAEVVTEAFISTEMLSVLSTLPSAQRDPNLRILNTIDDHNIVYRNMKYSGNNHPSAFILMYMSAMHEDVGHLILNISPMYKDFRLANDLMDEFKINVSSYAGLRFIHWRIPSYDNYLMKIAKSYGFNKFSHEDWCDCDIYSIDLKTTSFGTGTLVNDREYGEFDENDDAWALESTISQIQQLLPVMEADDDDDEKPTDYTADIDDNDDATEPDADNNQDDEKPTDYTADADADDDTDTPEDNTDDGDDNSPDTDALQSNDTGTGDSSDLGDTPTDYTDDAENGGDSPEDGDTDTDDENDDNADGDDEENDDSDPENDEDDISFGNNLIKNYNLLLDFERLSELTTEVTGTLDFTILSKPVQNKVLGQVIKNLNTIQDFIRDFIQFHFNEENYAFNLYYYNIVVQALKLNLKMLEENNSLSDEKTNK